MKKLVMLACATTLGLAGCADEPDMAVSRDTLTRRQRDSLIGKSSLPGAQGVTGALGAADSAAARAARLDSAGRP